MQRNLILVYPQKIIEQIDYGDISLALLYLAGAARDSGVCDHISIFDFNVPIGVGKTIDDLIDAINSLPEGTTVVGINCLNVVTFPSVREISAKIKEKFPSVKIVIGGMHPTLFAEKIIDNCPQIDAVAIGESDLDFPKLLRHFYEKESIENLEGFCLRIGGETVTKPKLSYVHDLDGLPRPGYEFINFQDYAVDTTNWWSPDEITISPVLLPLLTSRSCPYSCNFCSVQSLMGDKFRTRNAENVFEEIKYLYDLYGVNYFRIMDDNFSLNRKRVIRICEMIIESGIKVYFEVLSISLKTLDEELLHLMRRAGFILMSLTVESGSDYIRNKIMGKNFSQEQIVDAFKKCRVTGIKTFAVFIIGMPEETEGTLKETAEMIQKIDTDRVALFAVKPYPGTRLFEQCVRDNLLSGIFDTDEIWTGEEYLKYYELNLEQHFFIKPYNLSIEKLSKITVELKQIADEKSREWIEHKKRQSAK